MGAKRVADMTPAQVERQRANRRKYYHRCKEKEGTANWRFYLKQRYGMTVDEYNTMLTEQCGVCKLCCQPERVKGRRLSVDHCHKTGKVRGILCQSCNTGIGKLGDDPALLQRALRYLLTEGRMF